MKKKSSSVPTIIIIIIIFIVILSSSSGGSEPAPTIADGFTIEGYEVILDVGADNKIEVTENIDINFYEEGHHGIYKFTPQWLKYTGMDNKTIKRKSKIINYRAVGDNYTLDTVKKKARIKIGDAYKTVYGDKKYVIKYTYDMGSDPFKGFDELIFHAFGDYWGTEIKNPKIVVNMPKSIEGYNVNFFTDKYRKNNVNNLVNYQIDSTTLIATYNGTFNPLKNSLTVDIGLPEGYFETGSNNYGIISLLISIISIGLTGYIIYIWRKHGKDYEKRVPTVEFYAPDNLNSAEVGYVFNKNQPTKKLTISLIIELASKGYIQIDELKDEKGKTTNIQITKLKNRALSHKSAGDKIPNRQLEVIMLKKSDDNLSQKAKYLMTGIFENYQLRLLTDETKISLLYDLKDELVNNGYIKIVNDYDYESITDENEKKELYQKQIDKFNADNDELNKDYNKLSGMEKLVFDKLFEKKEQIILSEHTTFYQVFTSVNCDLSDRFNEKVYDVYAPKKRNEAILINILIIIMGIISYTTIEDLDPAIYTMYYVPFICFFINIIFIIIMTRRTDYGEIISARVKGFRDFLVTAEKEQLEDLVNKNPNYFYDILPYTYVLNISKKWIKKFEDIPMPEVNIGTFDYSSSNSFDSIYSNISFPVISSSSGSSSSSGCSSCGGGCSSCGGGCSSCGGGGSW